MVFQRENIAVCYLTPNLTSSKQPLDFGVIEIAKQRYKTLLLRDVLSFYQLDNENQQLQKNNVLNFVEDLPVFGMTDMQLC